KHTRRPVIARSANLTLHSGCGVLVTSGRKLGRARLQGGWHDNSSPSVCTRQYALVMKKTGDYSVTSQLRRCITLYAFYAFDGIRLGPRARRLRLWDWGCPTSPVNAPNSEAY